MGDEEKERFERMKRITGMAPRGSAEYFRNAARILSQFATQQPMRPDTRAKLSDLAQSADAETRRIAIRALSSHPYDEESD